MKRSIIALGLVACLTARVIAGGVEVHPFLAVWTWNEQTQQFEFSVNPVPQFDDQGGTRRLGRINAFVGQTWTATMVLDNFLTEHQCVDYSNYGVEAAINIPDLVGDPIITAPDGVLRGRFGAEPGQVAFRSVSLNTGGGGSWTRRDDEFGIIACTGTGFVPILNRSARGGFDTFRIVGANPNCSGGFMSGGPQGFSVPVMRFEWIGAWEYHWLDADCPVDLTALNNPSHQLYGVPDGILDSEDFFYFLAQFTAGNVAVADMTTTAIHGSPAYGVPNGVINNDDFFYFLTLFAQGC